MTLCLPADDEVRHGDQKGPKRHQQTPDCYDLGSVELGTEIAHKGDHQQIPCRVKMIRKRGRVEREHSDEVFCRLHSVHVRFIYCTEQRSSSTKPSTKNGNYTNPGFQRVHTCCIVSTSVQQADSRRSGKWQTHLFQSSRLWCRSDNWGCQTASRVVWLCSSCSCQTKPWRSTQRTRLPGTSAGTQTEKHASSLHFHFQTLHSACITI